MATRDEELAALTREDYEYRKDLLREYEDQMFGLKDDTSIIDNARDQVSTIAERGSDQIDRNMSRYGTQRRGAQAVAADRNLQLGTASTGTDLLNNATIAQEEANLGALGNLVSQGRRRQKNALAGLGDVAGMESQRIAAGQAAQQQYRAQRNQTLGTIATFAGFAMGL
jgi:hypothetical protein